MFIKVACDFEVPLVSAVEGNILEFACILYLFCSDWGYLFEILKKLRYPWSAEGTWT